MVFQFLVILFYVYLTMKLMILIIMITRFLEEIRVLKLNMESIKKLIMILKKYSE